MSEGHHTLGWDEDEFLAGEYVLGVMPRNERSAFAHRLTQEPSLAAQVREWEERLAPLGEAVQPIVPPDRLRSALERRLFAPESGQPDVWQSLLFFKALATASLAALVLLVAVYIGQFVFFEKPQENFVAELSGAGDVLKLVAFYDAQAGILKVKRVVGEPRTGRDFELWLIKGNNKPISLGVLPQQASGVITLPEQMVQILAGAVLAISDEPRNGSPTGQPTGEVLASGKLNSI